MDKEGSDPSGVGATTPSSVAAGAFGLRPLFDEVAGTGAVDAELRAGAAGVCLRPLFGEGNVAAAAAAGVVAATAPVAVGVAECFDLRPLFGEGDVDAAAGVVGACCFRPLFDEVGRAVAAGVAVGLRPLFGEGVAAVDFCSRPEESCK